MKKLSLFLVLFIFVSLSINSFAQDEQMPEDQKVWMEYMTPGPAHEMMKANVGEWKAVITFWMAPGGEPMTSEGTAVHEMILGGRYLQGKYTGTAMGSPMEGYSLEGYDNAKGTFTSIWVDNMGTGTMIAEGTYDKDTKVLNYKGKFYDPMVKSDVLFREVVTKTDADHMTMEMYIMHEGKEFKNMEIQYTRVK